MEYRWPPACLDCNEPQARESTGYRMYLEVIRSPYVTEASTLARHRGAGGKRALVSGHLRRHVSD